MLGPGFRLILLNMIWIGLFSLSAFLLQAIEYRHIYIYIDRYMNWRIL